MNQMISYAQNLEDVILWRAFKDVSNGFYVDVGANDPVLDSVTKWFYDQGWNGINIEPSAFWYQKLVAARSRDLNIQCAVGDCAGRMTFYEMPDTGLSTLDRETAGRYCNNESGPAVEALVEVSTLSLILSQHLPSGQEIHFLKIDVEGFETEVVRGLDLMKFRPWVIIIESTLPQSPELSAFMWEPILTAAGYFPVYFDGLNTFYLSNDHPELEARFGLPPNVFDDYVSSKVVALDTALKNTRSWGFALDQTVNALHEAIKVRENEIDGLNEKINALDRGIWCALRLEAENRNRKFRDWVVRQKHMLKEQGFKQRLYLMREKLLRRRAEKKSPENVGIFASPRVSDGVVSVVKSPEFSPLVFPEFPELPLIGVGNLTRPQQQGRDEVWIRIFGHVSGHYSLAVVNRGLALSLEHLYPGRILFRPFHGEAVVSPDDIPENEKAILQSQFSRVMTAVPENDYVVSISHHYPVISDPEPADLRLVLFFWEETLVPLETVSQINRDFDTVLVASRFVRSALRNSGCYLPIFIVPIGVSDGGSQPEEQPKTSGFRFRFLHVSSCFPRKGVDLLLKAFFDQYSGDDDVELYIKTFPNCHNTVHEQLANLIRGRHKPPKVIVDEGSLSNEEMQALYQSSDALVLPTRGEGFNLPAAEALACGLPLVVTGYGAHCDFASLSNAILIPFRFELSGSHVQSQASCWVAPDVDTLGRLMKSVERQVSNGEARCDSRQSLSRKIILDTYNWQRCAFTVDQVIYASQRLSSKHRLHRLAVISSWGCRCGIAEYVQQLLGGFSQSWSIDIYCDDRTVPPVEDSVHISWSVGSTDSVEDLVKNHPFDGYDVLLVQHQPSLFSLTPTLAERLAWLESQGVVVVLELHATKPLVREYAESPIALAALKRLSRIVVHHVDDMNNLLQLGMANNLVVMPHGAFFQKEQLASEEAISITKRLRVDLLLGTFGFALPHKGVDLIIRAIPDLENRLGLKIGLLAVTSALDSRSMETISVWQNVAAEIGVADRICWVTDYRPIDECISLLAGCDAVIYPYGDTLESASGAVSVGLSSLRPVVVSHAQIFSDLHVCTHVMNGCDVESIVDAICYLYRSPEQLNLMRDKQIAWLEGRSWMAISQRYEAMCRGLVLDHRVVNDLFPDTSSGCEKIRKQLLVDVSTIYRHDAKTGIQRVVHSILKALEKSPPDGFIIRPVYSSDGYQYRYTSKFSPANPEMVVCDECVAYYQAGDVFLGLDLTAHLFPAVGTVLEKMKLAGVRIAYVLHDILPLEHPEWFPPGLPDMFRRWLDGLAVFADHVVAISEESAKCVRLWFLENHPSSAIRVSAFFLGADFYSEIGATGVSKCGQTDLSTFDKSRTCITVGTVEIRKGYDQLLDAFELLWAQGVDVNLLVVGRPGWHAESLIDRLKTHALLGSRLIWFDDADDACLECCYEAASVLIASSYAEGFGLPLIEGTRRGLLVLARDIAVFREVIGDDGLYFADSEKELALKVQYALNGITSRRARDFEKYSWESSKNALLKALGMQSAIDDAEVCG